MSCLFVSLGVFLKIDPTHLRQQVCDFLLQNSANLVPGLAPEHILQTNIDTYVESMRKTSTWGTAIEIQAVCQMFGVEVVVWDNRGSPSGKIHFQSCVANSSFAGKVPMLIDLDWNGGHYSPRQSHPTKADHS